MQSLVPGPPPSRPPSLFSTSDLRPPASDTEPVLLAFPTRPADPAALTLEACYRECLLPELVGRGRAPDTLSEYLTHLRRWGEFWELAHAQAERLGRPWKYRITHPVLPEIGRPELLAFRGWLEAGGRRSEIGGRISGFSPRTVNKHLGTVQAVLEAAVRHALLPAACKLGPLPTRKAARKLHLSYAEADALKRACQAAKWPAGLPCPPAVYWEALLVGWCVYGFRTQEQVRYESRMRSLTWGDVRWAAETPHPDGKAVHPHGWLVYLPEKQELKKPEPLVLPIVEAYARHLQAIEPEGAGRDEPVFPFPLSNEAFYVAWRQILAAAGVRPKPGLDGTQPEYQIRHLRKTATTWLNDHQPGLAEHVTGHAEDRGAGGSRVSREHYDFAERRLIDGLTTLPLPPSFARPLYGGGRQQRFDWR